MVVLYCLLAAVVGALCGESEGLDSINESLWVVGWLIGCVFDDLSDLSISLPY